MATYTTIQNWMKVTMTTTFMLNPIVSDDYFRLFSFYNNAHETHRDILN